MKITKTIINTLVNKINNTIYFSNQELENKIRKSGKIQEEVSKGLTNFHYLKNEIKELFPECIKLRSEFNSILKMDPEYFSKNLETGLIQPEYNKKKQTLESFQTYEFEISLIADSCDTLSELVKKVNEKYSTNIKI